LNDTTREYFHRLAAVSTAEAAARYRSLSNPSKAAKAISYIAINEPGNYSMLRTTVVPTMLKAGFRSNVIPSVAEAELDVRALPDEDMDAFFTGLRAAIADPSIEIVPVRGGRPTSAPSSTHSEMFRALETVQRRMFPDAATLPVMLSGATDNAQLRARGVQAYGIGPVVSAIEGSAGGPHAENERIAVDSLTKLVQYLWYSVLEVAASR
jgi:acetylornithine deacetylase/succinyl-diaminopimelate desuccinylase-like protein